MENKLKITVCADNPKIAAQAASFLCESYKTVSAAVDDIDIKNKIKRFACCDAVYLLSSTGEISADLLEKWVGHPHLRCIAESDEEKRRLRLTAETDCMLKNVELEKKFLIKLPDMQALSAYSPFTVDIEQIYLTCQNGSHRIRKRGADGTFSYFETKKIRITDSKCFEYENSISADTYEQLKALADPKKHPIVKKRTCFVYEGQYFELDVFPFFRDKAFLELELLCEEQAFALPPEIEVIRDVTDDKKYKNNYLAGITDYDHY